MQRFLSWFMLAAAFTLSNAQAGSIGKSLQDALANAKPNDEIAIIIKLKDRVSPAAITDSNVAQRRADLIKALQTKANTTQAPLVTVLNQLSARQTRQLWLINGLATVVKAASINGIANRPEVDVVVLDAKMMLPNHPQGATTSINWNLNMVRAPDVWQRGYTGQGVVVATMDTGVDFFHPDIGSQWRGGANSWFDPYGQYASPSDGNGHGTQVMGLILGGSNSGNAIGMAPDAQWIAVKIFNSSNEALYSAIHEGFQWLLDPDGDPDVNDAPDIINNSWGLQQTVNTCDNEFSDDITVLTAADIAVVFSAGNSGPYPSSSVSPANNPGSFAAGAVDQSMVVAMSSSRGPSACDGGIYPHIAAPGVNVTTADLTFGGIFPDSYITVTGTSFSAAHVSGAMALLKSAVPSAAVTELEAAISDSAQDAGPMGHDYDYGAGVVDVFAAYNLLSMGGEPQPGALQFSTSAYSVTENGVGLTITVTRANGSSGIVTVDYATSDGTAQAGLDYQAVSGTLIFEDGVVSQIFSVDVIDDTLFEGEEAFNLELSNSTGGASLGTPTTAVVTIIEDDAPPPAGDLQFSSSTFSVAENANSVLIMVTRTGGSYGEVTVDYATADDTASAGMDYVANSGTLTFADGEISQSFSITILNDAVYEGDETLNLLLSNPGGGAGLGSPSAATLSITEDDPQIADADGDGFDSDVDCNDNDASIYPGATETKHDGIDQDCNGYDLTIDITRSLYKVAQDRFVVWATSDLGSQAALEVTIDLQAGGSITRTMNWKSAKNRWQRTINNFANKFGSPPISITVVGVEGIEISEVDQQ
jgi:serine protease AprX